MILLGASVYADFESVLFDVSLEIEGRIRAIQCPVLLAAHETGEVSIQINNPTDEAINRRIITTISRGHLILMNQYEDVVSLEPGERQKLSWEVTARDAVYGHLILAKVTTLVSLRNPLHRGTCGILVLNLPGQIKGAYVVGMMLVSSGFFLITGMWMWYQYGRSFSGWRMETTRAIFLLGGVVLAGLALSMFGFWELAAGAFYIAVLATGVSLPHFLINQAGA